MEKDLLPGTGEKMKNIRPTHPISNIMKQFGHKPSKQQEPIDNYDLEEYKNKRNLNARNTCINVFNQIVNYKIQKDVFNSKVQTYRSGEKTYLGKFNSVFEKEKSERIEQVTKLLNYRQKLSIDQENLAFEEQLEKDN